MTKIKQRTAKTIKSVNIHQAKIKKKLKTSHSKSKNKIKSNKKNLKSTELTSSKASTQAYSDISGTTTPSIKSKEDFLQYYQSEEKKTLQVYGREMLKYGESLEQKEPIPFDFLKKHTIPFEIRASMIQYISELLNKVKTEDQTFFLTVYIIDSYLSKTTNIVNEKEFFFISFTCLYIASKMESLRPFTIADVISLCHTTVGLDYTENEVFIKEKEIINTLQFNLMCFSSYDFMKTFICDFKANNAERIEMMKAEKAIELLETKCTEILKVSSMQVHFYQYDRELIAIAALIVSFDLLSTEKKFTKSIAYFLHFFINSLIKLSEDSKETIIQIYTELKEG